MEAWERVQYIMDKAEMNKNSFSEAIGMTNNVTITRIINEKRKPSRATCQKIINRFPEYSFDWLFSGEGEMENKKTINVHGNNNQTAVSESGLALNIKNNTGSVNYLTHDSLPKDQVTPNASYVSEFDIQYVPLVNQYAYAGYLDGYNDITYLEQLPKIPFIVDHEGKGNYVAFEIKGDSMDDGTDEGYKEGEKVLCREIAQHLWSKSKLHLRKWDFVIIHKDGILIKRIINHDVENHTITIHSLNDFYPDNVIDLIEVKQIFNVIESIKPRRR